MKFGSLVALLALAVFSNIASADQQSDFQEGKAALFEVGFHPEQMTERAVREAGYLRKYQAAWNDFDASVTDPLQVANPKMIVDKYTDGAGLLYRDMCMPNGVKSKANLMRYLTVLYAKFPRQIWGNGWKNIHLFQGSKPGEWAYYYEFEMYKSMSLSAAADLSGTGMERVQFDDQGKLISDEVHLILSSGAANCKFGPQ